MSMARVPYAMAERGAFPLAHIFKALHIKYNTPVNSIILKASIATIMILLLNPDRITDIAMFIMYLFYTAAFAGIFIVRKKFGVPSKGSYKTPFYPVIPILACVGALYICFSMFKGSPVDAIVSIAIAATGIPVFFWLEKNKK